MASKFPQHQSTVYIEHLYDTINATRSDELAVTPVRTPQRDILKA